MQSVLSCVHTFAQLHQAFKGLFTLLLNNFLNWYVNINKSLWEGAHNTLEFPARIRPDMAIQEGILGYSSIESDNDTDEPVNSLVPGKCNNF